MTCFEQYDIKSLSYIYNYSFVCLCFISLIGIQQDQIPIMKKKRALSTDEGGSENADEEEELTYLPIYNDPDEQFLIRHKFSPISKRSENSQPSANPQANVEEFKESYGTFLVLYTIYE